MSNQRYSPEFKFKTGITAPAAIKNHQRIHKAVPAHTAVPVEIMVNFLPSANANRHLCNACKVLRVVAISNIKSKNPPPRVINKHSIQLPTGIQTFGKEGQ